MPEKSYSHRKRIVYTALQPYFSREKMMKIIVLWEKKYARKPSSAVQNLVFDIKNTIDPTVNLRAIHHNLVKTSLLPKDQLLKDPSALVDNFSSKHNLDMSVDYNLSELQALQLFLRKWHTLIDSSVGHKINAYIIDNLAGQKININLAIQLTSWLKGRKKNIQLAHVNIKDLRKIVNLHYTASCEYTGPIESDRILNQTINGLKNNGGATYMTIIRRFL